MVYCGSFGIYGVNCLREVKWPSYESSKGMIIFSIEYTYEGQKISNINMELRLHTCIYIVANVEWSDEVD